MTYIIKKYWLLISTTMLFALLLSVAGCSSIEKATNKVLANPGAKEKVGREWEKANPCSNDTIIRVKRDTTETRDTSYLPGTVTTVNDTVFVQGGERVITRTITMHDTVRSFITDTRRLYIAEDSVRQYRVWLDTEKAETTRLNAEHNQIGAMLKYAGLALLKKWWFWLLIAAGAGLLYLNKTTGILSIFKRK